MRTLNSHRGRLVPASEVTQPMFFAVFMITLHIVVPRGHWRKTGRENIALDIKTRRTYICGVQLFIQHPFEIATAIAVDGCGHNVKNKNESPFRLLISCFRYRELTKREREKKAKR